MTYSEYIEKIEELKGTKELIQKQLGCLQSLQFVYTSEKFQVGQEYMLHFDLPELLEEYSWKVQKCAYFLSGYIDGIKKELAFHQKFWDELPDHDNVLMGKTIQLDEAMYNFDAFVLAASALLEPESKDYMAAYLRKAPVTSYYPKRNEIGLYWQLNLIRNRVVHHTGGRYDNGEVCQRFFDFSSRVNGIRMNNGNIELECTQLDVYRSQEVQLEIVMTLATGSDANVFDRLFPDKTGKGHGKRSPVMIRPGITLYFDHVSSGTRFVSEIQKFILNMNEAFFVEFSSKIKNKGIIPEVATIEFQEGKEVKHQVKDVFDISKIEKETL